MLKLGYLGIKLEERDKALLRRVCEARREDLSDFVRRAIAVELARLDYLSAAERKALGIRGRQQ